MDALVEFLLYMQGPIPYAAAFLVLLACGIGLPIPEDITLFAMGIISYYGLVDIRVSIIVCFLGVILGDCMIYYIGRRYGLRLTKKKGFFHKLFPPERMEKTRALFHRLGNKVIFAARFMPGLRAPTYFSAGALEMPFKVFIFYDGLAALLSVPLLTYAAYYFGDQVDKVIQVARRVQHGIFFVILGIIAIIVIKKLFSRYVLRARSSK